MAAATSDRTEQRQPGEDVAYTGASGYNYYKSTLVIQDAATASPRPLAAGISGGYFLGVVKDRVDLTAGLGASQAVLNIWKRGEFTFNAIGTGASKHIGRQAFAIDDQTVGVSAMGASSFWVGEITGFPTSTTYRVRIDNAVGYAQGATSGANMALVLNNAS